MNWQRVVKQITGDETVLISKGPGAWRGLMIHTITTFVVGVAALVAIQTGHHPVLQGIASGVLGAMMGSLALGRLRRARAYWSGWLKGRMAMVSSLGEARRRGWDMQAWLGAEVDRDLATIGLSRKDVEDDDAPDQGVDHA